MFDEAHNFTGTFGGAIYFNDLKSNFLNAISVAEGGYVAIIDDNGDILSHPDTSIEGKNFYSDEVQALINYSESYTNSVKDAAKGNGSVVKYSLNGQEKVGVVFQEQMMISLFQQIQVQITILSV